MRKPSISFLTSLLIFIIVSCSLFGTDLIDVVYTWVDGSDPQWQALLEKYSQKAPGEVTARAVAKRRFKDHDELRYSLRSIYQFAPLDQPHLYRHLRATADLAQRNVHDLHR